MTPLTVPQIALQVQEVLPQPACSGKAATLTKKLITKCAKKESATEHVRFIIIESLENVQANLN